MLDPTCCALTTARSGSTLLCRTLLAYLRHDQG
jgi:LPS sulfotransferase NodH